MRKKIFKKAIAAIMAAALMVTVGGEIAPGAEGVKVASAAKIRKSGDYKYVKYLNGVKISNYIGKAKKVTIPGKIAGKKVIAIESNTFEQNNMITQVKIPDSVKEIGSYAFSDCVKLKKVTLPKKLDKIGDGAFTGTAIAKIEIPEGVKEIRLETFENCKKLKEVLLSKDVRIIGRSAFAGCDNLSSINFDNLEEIGIKAFENNKSLVGELALKNVVTLGTEAFYGCSGITAVSFSDTLQVLGEREAYYSAPIAVSAIRVSGDTSANPFAYCSNIERFEIDVNNANYTSVDGVIYGKTNEWIVAYPAKKGGVVNIPENVKGISDYAYSGAQVSQINMSKGLNKIGKEAFAGCTATEVTMPLADSDNANWSNDAFLDCKSLKKVVFPAETKSANYVAFINCSALTDVVLPEGMEVLSDAMFFGCTSLETIILPKSLKRVPVGCFYGCKALKNVNLENLEEIGAVSFYGGESLSGGLDLNVSAIKTASFGNCMNITEVNFNNEVKEFNAMLHGYSELQADGTAGFYEEFCDTRKLIDEEELRFSIEHSRIALIANPFAGCSKLTKINVLKESEIKSVDGVLFSADMKSLLSYPAGLTGKYNIPYGVERIEDSAFEGAAVSEVVCSNSVISIYSHAFYNSKVKSVTLSKSITMIGGVGNAFDKCNELEEIKVHASNKNLESIDGVLYNKTAGKNTYNNLLVYPAAKKGKTFEVPKKTYISEGAFNGCKNLKRVYINDMKKYNNVSYFENCNNIKLYLPKNFVPKKVVTPEKGKYSFGFADDCTGCKTYVVKGSALAKKLDKKKIKYNKY